MNRALAGLVVAALFARIAAAEEEPFKVNKRDFEKTFKVIALAPPEADPYLPLSDAVKAMLEEEVTRRLQKSGFTVMPSSVLAGIRAEMTAQVGGAVDAKTGQPDPARQAAVREHAFRELWFRHRIDAIATIRIRIFSVPMENDRVEWDGTNQKLASEGKSVQYKANVSVSSVVVGIYDSKDAPLYVSYGGLEPLLRREGGQLQPLPAERLLLDEEKIRKAAQIAVKPI
jgi:hypothetical protein